jgi:transposase
MTDLQGERMTGASHEQPEVLTVEEAADLLRVSRNTAYTLAKPWRETDGADGLPVISLGRNLRVPRAGLQRLLDRVRPRSGAA